MGRERRRHSGVFGQTHSGSDALEAWLPVCLRVRASLAPRESGSLWHLPPNPRSVCNHQIQLSQTHPLRSTTPSWPEEKLFRAVLTLGARPRVIWRLAPSCVTNPAETISTECSLKLMAEIIPDSFLARLMVVPYEHFNQYVPLVLPVLPVQPKAPIGDHQTYNRNDQAACGQRRSHPPSPSTAATYQFIGAALEADRCRLGRRVFGREDHGLKFASSQELARRCRRLSETPSTHLPFHQDWLTCKPWLGAQGCGARHSTGE